MKQAVELSMNFFIITFLSLVILVLGIRMVYNMIDAAESVLPEDCTETDVTRMLAEADTRVVACPSDMAIPRSQSKNIRLGVVNTESAEQFRIDASVVSAEDAQGNQIPSSGLSFAGTMNEKISQNKQKQFLILAKALPNAAKGTYLVEVALCSGNSAPASCDSSNFYGSQKVYVNIP